MMKKILAVAGAGAILLSVAGPAFGMGWWWSGGDGVDINNWARVRTSVTTKADSGDNDIGGMFVCGGSIRTGNVVARSYVTNDVNSSLVGCVGCEGDVDIENHARVYTRVYTKADSGDNKLGGMLVGGGRIRTGDATAWSDAFSVVNLSVVGEGMMP